MSDTHGPIWIVEDPAKPYPDRRFDGVTPPLDPQQPTPEQIADAARLAVPNMAIVFRHWGYIQTHPLPELRALLDMLTPPAPKWTAKDENEHEDEETQSAEVPVLQAENATGMVEGRSGDHNPLDVQLLPAQPARQASEDAERLGEILRAIASDGAMYESAFWLRETLLGWLQIMVARGEKLGYIFAADEQPIIDALAALEL